METMEILKEFAHIENGAPFKATWLTDVPLSGLGKKASATVFKSTRAVVSKGIQYSEQESVKEKVAAGKVLTHELPWGDWRPDAKGLIIQHKGKEYVRLYLTDVMPKSEYIVLKKHDGKVREYAYTREELHMTGLVPENYFEKKSSGKPDALSINVDNIMSISTLEEVEEQC